MHSSERTGTDFSAVKHQSHQPSSSIWCFLVRSMRWILQISSERTGTDFSAVKHQSHQPSSSIFHQKQEVNSSDFFNRPFKYFLHRKNFCHSQSHPYGPGTCVGSKGSGWPGNWFECTAGWEEPTSDRPGISSTECTGPGLSAFKASADRPAKRTRPLTSYPVSQSRVFTKLVMCFHRPVTKFITWFTEQEGRKYILCTHVYCDSSFF